MLALALTPLLFSGAFALPHNAPARRLFGPGFDFTDSAITFDAPAFQADDGSWIAVMPAFISLREVSLAPATAAVSALLKDLGINVGDHAENLAARIPPFAEVGLPGKVINMSIPECSDGNNFAIGETNGLPDLGQANTFVNLGNCGTSASRDFLATVVGNDRPINATVFARGPTGFGIISDIDDSVKISDVLNKTLLAENTLLNDPLPVTGMPEVYASLNKTLGPDLSVHYVSGSPFVLYPFLHSFIQDNYPPGPIYLRNLTTVDIEEDFDFSGLNNTETFKLEMISRLNSYYPKRQFMHIGDSTERDPETYGISFTTHGSDFVKCIWIRKVEGANNTDERFAAAFNGVPSSKIRLYTDDEIPSLTQVDLLNGEC